MATSDEKSILKSATNKIICTGLILGVVFTLSSVCLVYRYMGETKNQRLLALKQAVQIARNTIEPILKEYRDQDISKENALKQVRNVVRRMVYNDHTGQNYIFMSSYEGIMLVQPFEPEKEMTDVWNMQDSYGVYIIKQLVKVARSNQGYGYVSYHYQSPGYSSFQEKISFVMGIPELECYIGTGQYMADIRKSQIIYITALIGLTITLLVLLSFLVWSSMKEIRSQNRMLFKAERELQAIFDNTFQFIGTLTPDGVLTKANRSSLEPIKKKGSQVVGTPFRETPWWRDEKSKNRLEKAIHDCSKGKFRRFETIYVTEKQETFHVDFSLSPILDDKGNIISLLAEGRDVTEQVKTRDALAREKAFFNYVIESLPGIFSLFKMENGRLQIKKWNQEQHEKLLGYSQEYMQDATMDMFVAEHDWPRLNRALEQVQKDGRVSMQFDIKTKSGSFIPVFYQATHFEHSGQKYIVAIGVELTEKIKAENERKKLKDMLAQSQKMEAMGALAGGIAHDFNNILSGIVGYSQLAESYIRKNPEKATECITNAVKAAQRATDLVQQILTFSRQTEYEKKPFRVYPVINEALRLLRSSIPVTIDIKQKLESRSMIIADPTKIHQIVMNLCTNAYHSMRKTGGTLTVCLADKEIVDPKQLNSRTMPLGRYLCIEVSDTGHGMNKRTLEKVFDPYFTTKKKGDGTGLGLAIVQAIIDEHDGFIEAISALGKGTSFYIYFPIVEEQIESRDENVEISDFHGRNETIMIVDDEENIRQTYKEILDGYGYQAVVFDTAGKALNAFKSDPGKFDILITDMTMPGKTGADLIKEIRTMDKNIPIILCTGFNEQMNKKKSLLLGVNRYLNKPLLVEELLKNIHELLNDKQDK